ncbi:hypothetical protein [Alteromonas gilva]|uniref:Bacteriocin n=1 Tax=Alteromonas gilva TaxID=2987522 RepID=A0ABT5KZP1_9ALTE|nr:hypothetical protein [Alteromonas gilva]MDC8830236.1 hypothetical protein [Alteromonas gilva]
MQNLTERELLVISGGEADWGEVAAGVGAVTLAVAIAATPVGVIGAALATGISYFGGTLVGSGLTGGDVWGFDG